MNKMLRTFGGLALLALIGCHKPNEYQKELALRAEAYVEEYKTTHDLKAESRKKPAVKGKRLIWDGQRELLHEANDHFHDKENNYSSGEEETTIFLVGEERKILIGHYSRSGEKAYQKIVDVDVVHFDPPEMKAIGNYEIWGDPPPQYKAPGASQSRYGDISFPIVEWIKSLPKE